jgi:anti-sigma B factor antagonist
MDIEFSTEQHGDKGLIVLEGDMDDELAGEALRRSFNKLFDSGLRTIVMDLQKVEIINSYGIGKILMCYKRLKAEGGELMVRPLSGIVKETFELLMLDTLFPVYRDEGEEGDDDSVS